MTTPNLKLNLPDFDSSPWHDDMLDNFQVLDAVIATTFGITNVKGLFRNSTAVAENDIYADSTSGELFRVVTSHVTSAAPATFAEDRVTNASYWEPLSVIAALAAATEALASQQLAEKWANEVEDTVVADEEYSAKHYVAKAAEKLVATNADAAQTALDRIATGADKTQTALDRVATGQDAAQTALDRVATGDDADQTGDDAAQTALDRIATGADADQTAFDRVATGNDVDATAADRIATGNDAVATAADRVATGEDVLSTAADVAAITGLTVEASGSLPDTDPDASYNSGTGVLSLTIPRGVAIDVSSFNVGDVLQVVDNGGEKELAVGSLLGAADLTTASTSGATQDIDFSAADIHVSTADEPVVTFTFSNPQPVDKVTVIIDLDLPGFLLESFSPDSIHPIGSATSVFSIYAIRFNPDKSKMYLSDYSGDKIHQYSLPTPGDLSVMLLEFSLSLNNPRGFDFSRDGLTMYWCRYVGSSTRTIYKEVLSTAWDLSAGTTSTAGDVIQSRSDGVRVNDDETKFWALPWSTANNALKEYTMSPAGDVTNTSETNSWTVSGGVGSGRCDFVFNDDYTSFFMYSTVDGAVYQFDMGTAGDISTMSGPTATLVFPNNNLSGITFFDDGKTLVIGDTSAEEIHIYKSEVSLVFPSELKLPAFSMPSVGYQVPLKIVTVDGGTSYQVVSGVTEGIS